MSKAAKNGHKDAEAKLQSIRASTQSLQDTPVLEKAPVQEEDLATPLPHVQDDSNAPLPDQGPHSNSPSPCPRNGNNNNNDSVTNTNQNDGEKNSGNQNFEKKAEERWDFFKSQLDDCCEL